MSSEHVLYIPFVFFAGLILGVWLGTRGHRPPPEDS